MIEKEDILLKMIYQDMTVPDLASRLGISIEELHDFLDRNVFTQGDLERIAAALGVTYVSKFQD